MTAAVGSRPKSRTRTREQRQAAGRLEIMLGDQKPAWVAFCAARNISPSEAVKKAIHRLMQGQPIREPFAVRPVFESKTRMVIRFTESEEAALRSRAQEEGFASGNQWVAAVVRVALTKTPQFGKTEVEALGESNLQLMKIGRNLNQIAKRLNAAQATADVRSYDAALVEDLASAIRKHVRKVGDALRASIYRWGLTDDSGK